MAGAALWALGAVAGSAHDDLVDTMFLGVLLFVGATLLAALVLLGAQLLYSIVPNAEGATLRRTALYECANTFLYALRVALCWTRYVFYDAQVEAIDMALHYTDELYLTPTSPTPQAGLLGGALDTVGAAVQIMLSLFKLLIAAFLLWLITDLFVQRPTTRAVTL